MDENGGTHKNGRTPVKLTGSSPEKGKLNLPSKTSGAILRPLSELHDLSTRFSVDLIEDLDIFEVDTGVFHRVPQEMAEKFNMFPLQVVDKEIVVAVNDLQHFERENRPAIEFALSQKVRPVLARQEDIEKQREKFYGIADYKGALEGFEGFGLSEITFIDEPDDSELDEQIIRESTIPQVVRFVDRIILPGAVSMKASDIHIEVYEDEFRVRFRKDGVLKTRKKFEGKSLGLYRGIVNRIKILAHLDIAESRVPQDGRIKMKKKDGSSVDFRVSTIPTHFGEKIVLRVLDSQALKLSLDNLGFFKSELELLRKVLNQTRGMILVTGPTGSGKTSTLYSSLKELNDDERNISTIEDPIEILMKGINQVQVSDKTGVTFASTLRALLRQDPDVMMVGEIRDYETAEIAIKASLTGHLVLSTLHTNDAVSTITRLIDMGLEPFLLIDSLSLICSQRLVRRICSECTSIEVSYSEEQLLSFGFTPDEIKGLSLKASTGKTSAGNDCPHCTGTGFNGRTAIYELLHVDDSIKNAISGRMTGQEIMQIALNSGMKTLRRSGIEKILSGTTTLEEVQKATI